VISCGAICSLIQNVPPLYAPTYSHAVYAFVGGRDTCPEDGPGRAKTLKTPALLATHPDEGGALEVARLAVWTIHQPTQPPRPTTLLLLLTRPPTLPPMHIVVSSMLASGVLSSQPTAIRILFAHPPSIVLKLCQRSGLHRVPMRTCGQSERSWRSFATP
jgi:hypothetical protein